ncbi:hypothetical protein JCM24511_05637 [Saitozyma sp. JCM 24511]|nr:hypothetical protein JCM24511_05637 [Saitozyma sp. JCM 24511]
MQGLLASTRARTVLALPPLFRRAMSSPTPQAPAAEASSSRARSPVRVPGPVETTMQSKIPTWAGMMWSGGLEVWTGVTGPVAGHRWSSPDSPLLVDPRRALAPANPALVQLIEAFQPSLIRISNDSSKHSHHAPMRAIGGGSGETHFAVALVSSAFSGKTQIARHRMVNSLLKEEFDAGLHALSLRLRTPQEWEKEVDAAVAQGKGQ